MSDCELQATDWYASEGRLIEAETAASKPAECMARHPVVKLLNLNLKHNCPVAVQCTAWRLLQLQSAPLTCRSCYLAAHSKAPSSPLPHS
jgi:hypothetical protein